MKDLFDRFEKAKGARGPAAHGAAERIFAVDAGSGDGSDPDARGTGIGLVPCSPLGKGFLTGKIDENARFDKTDFRSSLRRFAPDALKTNQALTDLLARIAQRKKTSVAQIALAWVLAQKPWFVPIPGTAKLDRLKENAGAVAIELTWEDLHEISEAASKIEVHGARYPEHLERMTGR